MTVNKTFQRTLLKDVASICQRFKKRNKSSKSTILRKGTWRPKLKVNLIVLLFGFLYIYIYICVCVCVCVCLSTWIWAMKFDLAVCSFFSKNIYKKVCVRLDIIFQYLIISSLSAYKIILTVFFKFLLKQTRTWLFYIKGDWTRWLWVNCSEIAILERNLTNKVQVLDMTIWVSFSLKIPLGKAWIHPQAICNNKGRLGSLALVS